MKRVLNLKGGGFLAKINDTNRFGKIQGTVLRSWNPQYKESSFAKNWNRFWKFFVILYFRISTMVSCCRGVMLQKDSFFKINFSICFHYCVFCAVLHSIINDFVRLLIETILKVHLYAKRKISDILDFFECVQSWIFRVVWFEKLIFNFIFVFRTWEGSLS